MRIEIDLITNVADIEGLDRDAADVAFATIFGSVQSQAPVLHIEAVAGADGRVMLPYHCVEALSTDG